MEDVDAVADAQEEEEEGASVVAVGDPSSLVDVGKDGDVVVVAAEVPRDADAADEGIVAAVGMDQGS